MIKNQIGQNIQNLRRERGLTPEELAEKTNVSTVHIKHAEYGYNCISIELLIKLCRVMNVTPNDILAGLYETNDTADNDPLKVLALDGIRPNNRKILHSIYHMMRNTSNEQGIYNR